MYALLRAIAGMALRWYYRDIQIEGASRIPRDRPLLLVVNHPNALVDALLVGWVMPRRVLITAKATLFANPIAAAFLKWFGVVPLRRASDEKANPSGVPLDAARNASTFRAVNAALARGGCVLIFPEGKTPIEPALAPLKTGAARMALYAHESASVSRLAILPIGLVFEQKEAPRSRVLVSIGEPLVVEDWYRAHHVADSTDVELLTGEIATRLRALTLSYPTLDDAARSIQLAGLVASVLGDPPPIGVADRGFAIDTTIARQIEQLTDALAKGDATLRERAAHIASRIASVQATAREHGIRLDDVRIDLSLSSGFRFIMREGWYLVFGGPVAVWGWLNHWLPLHAARAIARHNVESTADPAMRTIVAGAALVTLAYVAQGAIVGAAFGWIAAAIYVASLPIAADINFALGDRMRRARSRAHTFLTLRRDSALRARLLAELTSLREDIATLYDDAVGVPQGNAQ